MDPVWQADLLGELVRIESVNPDTWPGGAGEAGVAARLAREFAGLGLPVDTVEAAPGRPNLIVRLPGSGPRTLLLEAHMDTVQAEGMPQPFDGAVRDGVLHGRGACDDKGPLVAFAGVLAALVRAGVTPPLSLVLAAVSGEEFGGLGARALVRDGVAADAALIAEPTRLDVVVAHKGCVRAELVVRGRAAHSSRPEQGGNAIEAMAAVIAGLRARLLPLYATRAHPLAGPPTLAFTQIRGGVGINTIPERCVARLDRRVAPGERARDALAEMRDALAGLPLPPGTAAEIDKPFMLEDGMAADPDSPLVAALAAAARRRRPGAAVVGVPYGTDASRIAPSGIPCVVFGPGDIALAHGPDESVPLAEVAAACAVVLEAAFAFAGTGR